MAEDKTIEKKAQAGELASYDYGTDANAGFENTTNEDFAMPFLGILQALSPQISKKEEKIDGAEIGMMFNTVTEELFNGDKGIVFVPAFREQVFVEWKPREQGGGFVGKHDLRSPHVLEAQSANLRTDKGILKNSKGNHLIQTAYIYGIMEHEDGRDPEPAVIAFASTKLKVYRHFMTKVNQFQINTGGGKRITPPLFAHRLRVKSVEQSNQHGTFYNFSLEPVNGDRQASLVDPQSDVYNIAKKLAESVRSGEAKANYDSQDGGSGGSGGDSDDDIPFA